MPSRDLHNAVRRSTWERTSSALSRGAGWQWNGIVKSGNVIDAIVETASDMDTNLIVMSAAGRNGFLDALRGSHSERVLHRTPCPLLAIPVEAAVTPRLSAS